MPNDYFNPDGQPIERSRGISSPIRNLYTLIGAGFGKIPSLLKLWGGAENFAVDAGAANAYVITVGAGYLTSYDVGMTVRMRATNANTGASTINVNGLGLKEIRRGDGTVLQAGDIKANQVVELAYDGMYFQLNATAAAADAAAAQQAAASAAANSNFKGSWSSFGAVPMNIPASVYHNGDVWMLLNNIASVSASQPGVSADWFNLTGTSPTLVTGDWNTAATGSKTYVGVSLTNAPVPGRLIVQQIVDSSGFITQTAYPAGDVFGRVYFRQKQGGTWRAWRQLLQSQEAVVALGGGAIDCNAGTRFSETVNGSRTFTISNIPAAGQGYEFTLEILMTSGSVTWFANVLWPNNTAPTLTTGKRHVIFFSRSVDGTDWLGAYLTSYDV